MLVVRSVCAIDGDVGADSVGVRGMVHKCVRVVIRWCRGRCCVIAIVDIAVVIMINILLCGWCNGCMSCANCERVYMRWCLICGPLALPLSVVIIVVSLAYHQYYRCCVTALVMQHVLSTAV